jgi:hypothetical protein
MFFFVIHIKNPDQKKKIFERKHRFCCFFFFAFWTLIHTVLNPSLNIFNNLFSLTPLFFHFFTLFFSIFSPPNSDAMHSIIFPSYFHIFHHFTPNHSSQILPNLLTCTLPFWEKSYSKITTNPSLLHEQKPFLNSCTAFLIGKTKKIRANSPVWLIKKNVCVIIVVLWG